MTRKKISITQAARIAVQIILFLFLPSLYIGTLNGIHQIYLAVIHQSFSAGLLPQILEVLATIPVTILLGRFFCGWMCAFGSFTDFIYQIFHRFFRRKRRISEKADAWMKYMKYGILVVIMVDVWTFNATLFRTASPWDVFGMLATVGKAPDFSYVITNLTVGLLLFLAIAVLSAVYERFFCRYLCPMGAIFALVSKLRIAKIKKPSVQCGNCRMCTNSCAMGIPLYRMNAVSSGECINCLKCVSACPRGNAKLTIAQNDVRPLAAGVAAAAVMTGIYYGGNFAVNTFGVKTTSSASQSADGTTVKKQYKDGTYQGTGTGFESSASSQESQSASSSDASSAQSGVTVSGKSGTSYKDGTYQGSGNGFRGETQVSVTVTGGKITAVNADSYSDDQRFFDQAYSQVSQEIISSQSADVDAVSGATFSSRGIMQAVANALKSAVKS